MHRRGKSLPRKHYLPQETEQSVLPADFETLKQRRKKIV